MLSGNGHTTGRPSPGQALGVALEVPTGQNGQSVTASLTAREVAQTMGELATALARVVIDQETAIRRLLLAVACNGHALIEDVPGVGKTTLARALAEALGVEFARIQGTTDLMPAEITGVSIWNAQSNSFAFHPGPLMKGLVLFDELNRATPKTQSALLEAMQERQVTVDGVTHHLPQPFLVLATQNPIDYEGTFALTEAQRDRFFIQVAMGYPSFEGAQKLFDTNLAPARQVGDQQGRRLLEPVVTPAVLNGVFAARASVYIDPTVRDYILLLAEATRRHPDVRLGLSPRAALTIAQAAQANAIFDGRDHVKPDDVQAVLEPVAAHRLILHARADLAGRTAAQVIEEIREQTAAPAWPAQGNGQGNGQSAGLGAPAPRSKPLLPPALPRVRS